MLSVSILQPLHFSLRNLHSNAKHSLKIYLIQKSTLLRIQMTNNILMLRQKSMQNGTFSISFSVFHIGKKQRKRERERQRVRKLFTVKFPSLPLLYPSPYKEKRCSHDVRNQNCLHLLINYTYISEKNIQQVLDLESQHYKSAERTVFINQIHYRGEGPHFLQIKVNNYWNNCPYWLYSLRCIKE